MRQILHTLRSQIQYTIILPYLALTVMVMLAGASLALLLVARDLQERFDNQLLQVGNIMKDGLARHEATNLSVLFQIAFAPENTNPANQAPSVAGAIALQDIDGLKRALSPYYQINMLRNDWVFDRLIAFDLEGKALVDWQRDPQDPLNKRIEYSGTDLSDLELVRLVRRGEQEGDVDKYSALIEFLSDNQHYFFTVVPVRSGDKLVGGVLVAARLDRLMVQLQQQSQSVVTAFYSTRGLTLASTLKPSDVVTNTQLLLLPNSGLNELDMSAGSLEPFTQGKDRSVMTVPIDNRDYQFLYAPLRIGTRQVGFYSVALARQYIISPISISRYAIMGITLVLACGTVMIGYGISQRITRPLQDLVGTAQAVSQGYLEQRSNVANAPNELGTLAQAFNQMTEHLLRLYHTSRDLNQALDLAAVLDVTGRSAHAFVPGTEAIALLAEADGWRYHVGTTAGAALRSIDGRLSQAAEMICSQNPSMFQQVLSVADLPPLDQELGLVAAQHTVLLTRLMLQDAPLGVLALVHTNEHAFDEGVLASLVAVSNMSVTVIHNATLYTRVQQDASERQAILRSIADGVVMCDNQQQIVMANRAAEELLQLNNWAHSRVKLSDIPLARVATNKELFGATQGSEHYQFAGRTLALNSAPVVADDGHILGEVVVLHDLSMEAAVSQAKTDFIATISHELRTPLTPIFGNLDLLLRGYTGPLNEEQTDMLKQVRKRAGDIHELVKNMIMIVSIEADTLTIDLQPQDLQLAVESALAPLRPSFATKGIALHIELPDDVPMVLADRELLKMIFTQLLENARRFTLKGEVHVSAQWNGTMVQVDIADTGIGIPAEAQDRLFSRFQRIEGNNSPERGGGLGLAITRQIVDRQGGRVWVKSSLGQGSVFSFVLPQVHEQALAVAQSEAVASN